MPFPFNSINSTNSRNSITFFVILLLFSSPVYAELENFQAADVVLGQPNFTSSTANNGGVSARSFNVPGGVYSDGEKFFATDFNNNRLLIWNQIPTTNFAAADLVLGQPNFSSSAVNAGGGVTARSMNTPRAVYSDGRKLFVADRINHRILIWNKIPNTNYAPADVVVGQPDLTSSTANNGGISARSINNPTGVFSDGKKLFVVDDLNHRALIWNQIPSENFAPADVVLGQPNFTSNAANNGGISAKSMSTPQYIFSDGKRLLVTDTSNRRVLIWNGIPTSNHTPADIVIGQPDFNSGTANNGGVTASSLNNCNDIGTDGKRLFVGDHANNRVLIWNNFPTINFEPANVVLGQPNFNSNTANIEGVTARAFNTSRGVFTDGKRLFVVDTNNNRILIYNISGLSQKHDPQFEQGKAVVGKVFNDMNGNGIQDKKESGIEGIKIVSDTGIYAITDQDGKYHFPYIETGQHVLKLDQDTLPEGSTLTTDNPYKATVTKGILTKVSFGVKLKELNKLNELNQLNDLLNLSITQDTSTKPIKKLGITAEIIDQQDVRATRRVAPTIRFTTTCNYYLFIKESMILLYDSNQKPIKTLTLPQPIPLYYEVPLSQLALSSPHASGGDLDSRQKHSGMTHVLYYQLVVRDAQGHEDRTAPGRIEIPFS